MDRQTKEVDNIKKVVSKIPVADIFYSIQGEGFNVGVPSIFIRFAGCNLRCPWCDSWWAVEKQIILAEYDDTNHNAKQLMKYLLHRAGIYETGKANIIFTGGEPTLYQGFVAKMIQSLPNIYDEMKTDLPLWVKDKDNFLTSITFEMETNGIIYPDKVIEVLKNPIVRIIPTDIPRLVFEMSPKLIDNIMNDKMYQKVVENIKNLKEVENETNSNISFICKFVTDGRPDEIEKISEFIKDTEISRRKVYLMPKCSLDEQGKYAYIARNVANVCMRYYWRFSPREQVVLFGKFRSA